MLERSTQGSGQWSQERGVLSIARALVRLGGPPTVPGPPSPWPTGQPGKGLPYSRPQGQGHPYVGLFSGQLLPALRPLLPSGDSRSVPSCSR